MKAAIRLGKIIKLREMLKEQRSIFVPVPLVPKNGSVVYVDQAGQKQVQAQLGTYEPPERNTDKPRIPPALKDPKYLERIRTQHELPKMPKPPHNPMSITRLEPMHSADWML